MDSWNLFSKIDYLIGIDVQIRVTFNINVTTNFSMYLLHLSFSPQKKKHQIFFGYLRIRSQIPASEVATFLILMMQVHLRGHVRISIQIDICAVLSMMWTCYEMQRGENITVEKIKTGKRVSGSGAFTGCCISFILFDTSCEFERGWVRIIAASYYHSYYRDTGFMI